MLFPCLKKKKKRGGVRYYSVCCGVIRNVTHLTHFHMLTSEFLSFLLVLLVLINDKKVFFATDEEESYFFIHTS